MAIASKRAHKERGCKMMSFYPIGGTAYLKQPERKDENCGTIVSKGDGMVRLQFVGGRTASYFYSELY